ncbi:acyl-CoA/acyl-ACP dehydrogenase [Sphingobacteriaceae bacterium WQ 2009]|uniref:Acyl-CoA/acyl-ACP dehydrogenase n=1 Tax=Rhinopithecimicrobium faecis TaxID=2820698 RepID=A0A8T4H928_9SPHI|nr:acyl-CoA/acyl-ACP dehydrogenase [Sphingobacteriaceae bacterium WQ 2009]
MSIVNTEPLKLKFEQFIKDFEHTLNVLFHKTENIDLLSLERGLPDSVWHTIMEKNPLSVAIPSEFGGRGSSVKECLGLLAAASYESLPLSLTFGINIALFLEPVTKYAQEDVKSAIFADFLKNKKMGGLMITEPDFGSDALNMKTFYTEAENSYKLKGTKHWQGLTGMADYWLVTSRKKLPNGDLSRDIDFFITDNSKAEQHINVLEYYDNLGLYMIPYGLNDIDLEVPKNQLMVGESTGIKMMLDILHRSRLQFPGMGMGFIKRMLDEGLQHCKNRMVGAGNLLSFDHVQFLLTRLQAAYTINSAMCTRSVDISGVDKNVATNGLEANAMKTVVTDLMQECAQIVTQLSGANGYKISNIAGRGTMDSRPFQIFEGSNEMLYSQIADTIIRDMKKKKFENLADYLAQLELTAEATKLFKNLLDFRIDGAVIQRKQVVLGKAIALVINAGYVIKMVNKGYREDLADACYEVIRHDIATLINSYENRNHSSVIVDYQENSSWLAL